MYQQYFHLSEPPFSIAPDPHFIYMSERHQEGLAHLLYGINMGGGFVALTGEVGTGKTTLCRCLLEQLPAHVDIALILNPKLNAIELLSAICDELGINYADDWHTLKKFIDKINQYLLDAYSKGRTTVLLIDEAQNLSREVLEQIRLLTNLETSKTKLLQIVLVGQPELKTLLNRRELRQLNQRITARYHLLPLSLNETRAYIQHRLAVCNGYPELFRDSAVRKVYQFSGGVPRIINILCDRAMLGAYATNAYTITPKIVTHAAREALGLTRNHRIEATIFTALCLASAVLAVYAFHHNGSWSQQIQILQPKSSSVDSAVVKESRHTIPKPASKAGAEPAPVAFERWLEDPKLALDQALIQALDVWKKELPSESPLNCAYLSTTGLHCLFDKASWKEIIELDRPAILEFSLASEEKRYALLVGIDKGNAVIHANGDIYFPLTDVMKFWNGNFLILWQPPLPGMLAIAPPLRSESVIWLRKQLNLIEGNEEGGQQSPIFDQSLKTRVMEYQRRHHLTTDGVVGVRTLIHLVNEARGSESPHLKISH